MFATAKGAPRIHEGAAIDVVTAPQIQQNQLQINLSESLDRVSGMCIANRRNYAQDLMVSIRGFGARAIALPDNVRNTSKSSCAISTRSGEPTAPGA